MWKTFFRQVSEKLSYEIENVVYTKQTALQLVEIVKTKTFGLSLFLDESPQSSAVDEFIYHEALVHPALVTHPNPKIVFVAGGGEGAVLREVLKHDTTCQVTMVDIDEELVNICKEYLFDWHLGAFDDERVQILHLDARKFLEDTNERFDCIIVDVTAPKADNPSCFLFTKEFYQLAHGRLSSTGIMVVQAQSTNINNLQCFLAIARTIAEVFPVVKPYRAHIPFDGDSWGYVLASKECDPSQLTPDMVDAILRERACQNLKFYDGVTHQTIFLLPKFLRVELQKSERIITDEAPFTYTKLLC